MERTPAEKSAFNAMRAEFGRLGEARAFLQRKRGGPDAIGVKSIPFLI